MRYAYTLCWELLQLNLQQSTVNSTILLPYMIHKGLKLSIFSSHALTLIAHIETLMEQKRESAEIISFNLHKTFIIFMLYYCSTFTVLRYALYNG